MNLEPVITRIIYIYISIVVGISVTVGIAIGALAMYFLR
jgi:hypothetical protein